MKKIASSAAALLFCDFCLAAGAAYGTNGSEIFYGDQSYGIQTNSQIGNGGNGADIVGKSVSVNNQTVTGTDGGTGGSGAYLGGGVGGLGGGAVYGAISFGQAAGGDTTSNTGGTGGMTMSNIVTVQKSTLIGGAGGNGGAGSHPDMPSYSAAGQGGHGGASVFGSLSAGGAGGARGIPRYGGDGGISGKNIILVEDSTLDGSNANGGTGGAADNSGGNGGYGGGSVFGGVSNGAGGGGAGYGNAGNGGQVSDNQITLNNVTLIGGAGGNAGSGTNDGAGAGGHGGGSVFGAISSGAAGGHTGTGGSGGDTSNNLIVINNSKLTGGAGGKGGNTNSDGSGAGAGGHGGGSVFGSVSAGGAGGINAGQGGKGGDALNNRIYLNNVTLIRAAPGTGGIASKGTNGLAGLDGGSVYGGVSFGGAGGRWEDRGGDAGNVTGNEITISGETSIGGSVYGGYTQGGNSGTTPNPGKGGYASKNTVTLMGDNIFISGSIYGGISFDGDQTSKNPDDNYQSYYKGNTLQIRSGQFNLNGSIENFQNYNWLLPQNQFNGLEIINVTSAGTPVNINNTIHKVDVQATGNTLDGGDKVILITKVTGDFDRANSAAYLEQGFFIVYDAKMDVEQFNGSDALVLTVLGVNDGNPDGKNHPESEEFLKGRIGQLAIVDQGADMISDGISYARASLRNENANIFAIVDGGSNKYKNGGVSTLKLNDFKFALGAAKAWELESKSVGMIAAFAEHGNGNYSSYNNFDYFGETRGSGKLRYSGLGLMFHMDVADTDKSKVQNKPNIFDDKYGLYLDAALRVGNVKVDFHSADMVNGAGVEAYYSTKSRYASAMAGVGYVWTLDEKSAIDFYGRVTFSRLNGKDVQVIDEQMYAAATHSKRLRVGARYGYAYSDTTTPYAGLAFERNFTGDVAGSAYGFTIKETSLKGNTGILEAGVMIKPKGADDPFSMHLGVQGYFGQRKGVSAGVRARYVF